MDQLIIRLLTYAMVITMIDAQSTVHVISGATFTEISNSVIPYTSSTPLFYKNPYHTTVTKSIPKTNLSTPICTFPSSQNSKTCQQQRILEKIQEYIHEMLLLDRSYFDPQHKINTDFQPTHRKRSVESIGNILEWCCNVATMTNIKDMSLNELQVDDKLNKLLDFVRNEHLIFTMAQSKLNNYTLNLEEIFHNITGNIQQYENYTNSNLAYLRRYVDNQLLQHTMESWLYIYLTIYYSHLHQIEEDCQVNKIPELLISIPTLTNDLLLLQKNLLKVNLDLAIPITKTFTLYSLQIAKCYYDHESIIVQVQIPIIPTNTSYKTYVYHPIPLTWENKICQLPHQEIVLVKTQAGIQIVDAESNDHCNYKKTNLCLIPRHNTSTSAASMCAMHLLHTSNVSVLSDYCEFHCYLAPSHVVLQQTSPSTFILTNIKKDLYIHCSDLNLTQTINKINIGSLELHLPCTCQLFEEDIILVHRLIPCDKRDLVTPRTFHLIPQLWTNLDDMRIDPLDERDRTEFHNITSYLMPSWHLKTPTFITDGKTPMKLFEHVTPQNSWLDIIDDRRLMIHILLVWITILTILLFIAMYYIHITNIKLQLHPPPIPPRDL